MTYEVRSLKVLFLVEQLNDEGQLVRTTEIPVAVFEAQFKETLSTLVARFKDQLDGLAESAKAGEVQKVE